jgi:hypothetical protein
MKVEQTSKLIKAANSTIQKLVNAIVGAMKINSQEIARSSVVPRSIYANHGLLTKRDNLVDHCF